MLDVCVNLQGLRGFYGLRMHQPPKTYRAFMVVVPVN